MTGALLLLTTLLAPKWEPTLTQEFAGPKGQAPDAKIWARDLGGGGFGNNELQSYTDGNKNAFLDGDGHLVIEARKEPTKGSDNIARDYSSARLKTKGHFTQRYGKFEARMKMPRGQGIWPAFWMLGDNIDQGAGWPACGEIDILEFIGREPKMVYGTLHGPGYSGGAGIQGKTTSDTLSDAFHTYAVEWEPGEIRWYFDGKLYNTIKAEAVKARDWPFEKPQFIILNLAVGGGWPGYPDATTVFPQRLVIDYVRVYKDANLKVDEAAIAKMHRDRIAAAKVYRDPGPQKVPGVVKLGDYLSGGEGVAYHDADPDNKGGAYRENEGVDLGEAGPADAPISLGWTQAGEWLYYAIDVAEDGNYAITLDAAREGDGGKVSIEIDGKKVATGTVKGTGGWVNWQPVSLGTVRLTKGHHKLKLSLDENGTGNTVGNLGALRITKA